MKNLFIIWISLLFSGMMARAQAKAQAPAQGKEQPRTFTPAQEAEMIAQMQAQAKKMTISQWKVELEKSPNPVLYTKQILK
ncbi:MAG TPA: hypothetical protein VF939_06885, partial [Puia sp.]